MKSKFVKVWDQYRFGCVGFIVLQVEDTDKELIEQNFNPGYKFIIQAIYNQVGAAGGNEFIPAYGTRTRDTSYKMDTVEGDVLGFYLNSVKNIYDIPDELYTENFWNIVLTDNEKEDGYENDRYYKVLICNHIKSFNEYKKDIELVMEKISTGEPAAIDEQEENVKIMEQGFVDLFINEERLNRDEKMLKHIGGDLDKSYDIYSIGFVDKETLEINRINRYGESSNELTIAEYNWLPNDVIPKDLWAEAKKREEELEIFCKSYQRI